MPNRPRLNTRRRAQSYIEFGLCIAVVVIVAMMGFDFVSTGVYDYFTGEGTQRALNPPTPTPVAGLPPHRYTTTSIECPGNPDHFDAANDAACTVYVSDPADPTWRPADSVTVSTTATGGASGTVGFGELYTLPGAPHGGSPLSCTLVSAQAFGRPGSKCDFQYRPGFSGSPEQVSPTYVLRSHTLIAAYSPAPATNISPSQATLKRAVRRLSMVRLDPATDCAGSFGKGTLLVPLLVTAVARPTSMTCSALVWDIDNRYPLDPPTLYRPEQDPQGTLTWSPLTAPATSTITPSSCAVVSETCAVTYVARTFGTGSEAGSQAVQIHYASSDRFHSDQNLFAGPQRIIFADQTTTRVLGCSGPAQVSGAPVTCTVEVKNETTPTRGPVGTVSWLVNDAAAGGAAAGNFSGSAPNQCVLPPAAPNPNTCTVQYQPTNVGSGTHVIIAQYNTPYGNYQNQFESTQDGVPIVVTP